MQAPPMALAAATRALEAGRLTLADVIARLAYKERPSAGLLLLRGRIGIRIGQIEPARRLFREALALDPGLHEAADELDAAYSRPPRSVPPRERYLLIREWSQGFWSDADHVLGGLVLAELSGRKPVVLWGASSRYRDAETLDAFTDFFRPVSEASAATLVGRGHTYWPPKWNDGNILGPTFNVFNGEGSRTGALELWARDEDVVVADFHNGVKILHPWIGPGHRWHERPLTEVCGELLETRLVVRDELRVRAEAFVEQRLRGRPSIGIHIRAGDKVHEVASFEQDLAFLRDRAEEFRASLPGARVFLMTDSATVAGEFRSRYGDELVTTEASRTPRNEGLHFQRRPDRRRLGEEVLVDTLIAARCDRFVGDGWSNVACMVRHLKRWEEGHVVLLPPFMHETVSHLAYDPGNKVPEPRPVGF